MFSTFEAARQFAENHNRTAHEINNPITCAFIIGILTNGEVYTVAYSWSDFDYAQALGWQVAEVCK